MKQFMQRYLRHFACVTLACWFFISIGSVQAHLCLDGKEPPVSFALSVHKPAQDHHDDPGHNDIDINPVKLLLVKLFKIDLSLLLLAFALLIFSALPQRHVLHRSFSQTCHRICQLRPPLRAPPAFPA